MSGCAVIELNDAAISLFRPEREPVVSPAYAVVSPDELKIGERAFREARLRPHLVHTQFWSKLSMNPLPQPGHGARNYADLAYAHLLHLWESSKDDDDEVIFVVPSTFGREQLALLLGISRECPFDPVGLVDSAVAAAADLARPGPMLHVDFQLQRAVITVLRSDAAVERESLEEIEAVGIASLRDAWIGLIADIFISETRFDPLHSAESEQTLYNELSNWLRALRSAPDVAVEIETAGTPMRISLARTRLIEHVRARYDAVVSELSRLVSRLGQTTILVSHRVNLAPGLTDAIAAIAEVDVIVLDKDAAARGALSRMNEVRSSGEALAFVTRLSAAQVHSPAQLVPGPPAPAPRARATHLLWHHTAYVLSPGTIVIGGPEGRVPEASCNALLRHDADATRLVDAAEDLRVNDEPASAVQELRAGDRIQCDGQEYLLITLAPEHGS
ncbi:MAG: hypothetical protein V3U43_10175 [Pseudomonadales bacterium]